MQENSREVAGGLLNIKQAAQLLNVSQVSLRRWTDGGKLACLRVGDRRERRFRREDLFAFAERQTAAAPAGEASKVRLEGIAIERGSHLCSLYQSDLGRLKLSVPYLAGGLRAGETCYLIADDRGQDEILGHLGEVYDGVGEAMADGRLIVSDGATTGSAMFDYLERSFTMAVRSGRGALRLVGDMVWAVTKGMDPDELMRFETRYNQTLARRFPAVSLCQYDVRQFSGIHVHEVLLCHEDTFCYPLSRFI